jgi:Domain of unknown function (DUF4082)
MARIWDRTPAIGPTNSGDYTFGVDVSCNTAITVEGLLWFAVSGTGPPTITALWLDETGATVLASGIDVPATGNNEWVLIPFDTPFPAAAGNYVGVVQISDEYQYDTDVMPVTSTDGHVEATQGRFQAGHTQFPGNTWTGWHGFDVEYELSATSVERWGLTL